MNGSDWLLRGGARQGRWGTGGGRGRGCQRGRRGMRWCEWCMQTLCRSLLGRLAVARPP
ncbi:unnamed protein product, partial [Closterium sp. NIES-54]